MRVSVFGLGYVGCVMWVTSSEQPSGPSSILARRGGCQPTQMPPCCPELRHSAGPHGVHQHSDALAQRDRLRYRRSSILGDRPIHSSPAALNVVLGQSCRYRFLATARLEQPKRMRKGGPCTCFAGHRAWSTEGERSREYDRRPSSGSPVPGPADRRIHLPLTFGPR